MANICFFDDDFYEIYENEEDCPLKKGYLLVKKEYFLFSVNPFPNEIINLSDNDLKNIFYPKYNGDIIFDKYFPPQQFNNFPITTGYVFTKRNNIKEVNKYYSLFYHKKDEVLFYDNKNNKQELFKEDYNKIYKGILFYSLIIIQSCRIAFSKNKINKILTERNFNYKLFN